MGANLERQHLCAPFTGVGNGLGWLRFRILEFCDLLLHRGSAPDRRRFVFSPTRAYICSWSCCVVLAFGETHQWAQAHIFVCLDRLRDKPVIFHGFRS